MRDPRLSLLIAAAVLFPAASEAGVGRYGSLIRCMAEAQVKQAQAYQEAAVARQAEIAKAKVAAEAERKEKLRGAHETERAAKERRRKAARDYFRRNHSIGFNPDTVKAAPEAVVARKPLPKRADRASKTSPAERSR